MPYQDQVLLVQVATASLFIVPVLVTVVIGLVKDRINK